MEDNMITNHHRNELQERVQRGIALLDKEYPEWRSKIKIETLDLSNGCHCVLGQVYEYFFKGVEIIGLVESSAEDDYTPEEQIALVSHGFYGPSYEYGELTRAWREALEEEHGE